MGFWSDFRSFLRTREEILDRLDRSEREIATLKHRIDTVDDFVHDQSRKRYQQTYIPETRDKEKQEVLPPPLEPGRPLTKAELRERHMRSVGVNVQQVPKEG